MIKCCRGKLPTGLAPVHLASRRGHVRCLKDIIAEGADVDAEDTSVLHRARPIHLAAAKRRANCVQMLIRAGADYEAKDYEGRTSLDLAADSNHRQTVFAHTTNVVSFRPSVALNYAVRNGNLELIAALLNAGFDPNFRDPRDGTTSFHKAGSWKVLKLLLKQRQCDLDARDSRGRTPLYYASWLNYMHSCSARRRRLGLTKLMLVHGASPSNYDGIGSDLLEIETLLIEEPCIRILNAACYSVSTLPNFSYSSLLDECDPEIADRYMDLLHSPRTLLHYSRCAIRRTLRRDMYRVDCLPLPDMLKQYLFFEWSDEILF